MREILFRGKCLDDGEWIFGYYTGPVGIYSSHEICDISDPIGSRIDVDPVTIGQYTGLTDKNGTKIFEGDIVRAVLKASKSSLPFEWPAAPVVYKGSSFGLAYKSNFGFVRLDGFAPTVTCEVIGNVHDNPELMEVRNG